jgi:hypothetical protein
MGADAEHKLPPHAAGLTVRERITELFERRFFGFNAARFSDSDTNSALCRAAHRNT